MSKRLLIILLIVSITFSGVISGCIGEKSTSKGQYKDLEIVMELEKTIFEQGEKIFITLTVTNNGDDIATLDVKGFNIGIYSLDEEKVTAIKQRRGDKTVNLGPGVSIFEYFNWYQTYKGSDNIDTELNPGKYYIIGYFEIYSYKDSEGEYPVGEEDIKTEPLIMTVK